MRYASNGIVRNNDPRARLRPTGRGTVQSVYARYDANIRFGTGRKEATVRIDAQFVRGRCKGAQVRKKHLCMWHRHTCAVKAWRMNERAFFVRVLLLTSCLRLCTPPCTASSVQLPAGASESGALLLSCKPQSPPIAVLPSPCVLASPEPCTEPVCFRLGRCVASRSSPLIEENQKTAGTFYLSLSVPHDTEEQV